MGIEYKKERFIDIMPELPELFVAHDQEVHIEADALPLDPNWKGYLFSEHNGALHIMTARDGADLIGYVFMFVNKSYQCSKLIAVTDLIYLKPAYRKGFIGYKLLKAAKEMARERGAVKVYFIEHGSESLGPVFERLGAKKAETVFAGLL